MRACALLLLQYWAPPHAALRLDSYMYHEPGERLRESLLVLEALHAAHYDAKLAGD